MARIYVKFHVATVPLRRQVDCMSIQGKKIPRNHPKLTTSSFNNFTCRKDILKKKAVLEMSRHALSFKQLLTENFKIFTWGC